MIPGLAVPGCLDWDREISCRCGCLLSVAASHDPDLFSNLQQIMFVFLMLRGAVSHEMGTETPLTVTSGFRCETYNGTLTNSSPDSWHIRAGAFDIARPLGLEMGAFHKIGRQFSPGGLGVYYGSDFLHLDIGPRRAWAG